MSRIESTRGRDALLRVVGLILAAVGITACLAVVTTEQARAGQYTATPAPCQLMLPPGGSFGANAWAGGIGCGSGNADLTVTGKAQGPAQNPYMWYKSAQLPDTAYLKTFSIDSYYSNGRATPGNPAIRTRGCLRNFYTTPANGGSCAGYDYFTLATAVPSDNTWGWRSATGDPVLCGTHCAGIQFEVNNPVDNLGNLSIRQINAQIGDDTLPIFTPLTDGVSSGDWLAGSTSIGGSADDDGAGVQRISFTPEVSDPAGMLIGNATCSPGAWVPCPATHDWSRAFDTKTVSDGQHTGRYAASDYAGNVVQDASFAYKTDNTKPAAPASLALADETAAGWQNVNDFDASWSNTGETVETATESGIAEACYDIGASGNSTDTSDPDPVCASGNLSVLDDIQVPAAGSWPTDFWTVDAAGNESPVTAHLLQFDPAAPGKPTGRANGWIGLDELMNDRKQLWDLPPVPLSEFCGVGFSVDQNPNGEAPTTITHPGKTVTNATIPSGTPEGHNWAHFRMISCSGALGATTTVAVDVDLTKPTSTVTGIPESGWTNDPGAITASGNDAMPGSGMDPAPVSEPDVTRGASQRFTLDGNVVQEDRGATGTFNGAPLTEGPHSLTVSTFDFARNHYDQVFSFGVDKTAPSGTFVSPNADDPATFSVATYDELSGATGGVMQYAPVSVAGGVGEFKDLPTTFDAGLLTATFPDTRVPAGQYALRGRVVDAATNVGYATENQSGEQMVITTPLRDSVKMRLSVSGSKKRCKKRKAKTKKAKKRALKLYQKCLKKRAAATGSNIAVKVSYGRRSFVTGRLTDKNGAPITNQAIHLSQSGVGMPLGRIGGAGTDADGYFTFTAPQGISRSVFATWAGTKTKQDVTARVALNVPTKVSLKVRPRAVHGRRAFKLSGRLYAHNRQIARSGKLVQLQFWNFQRRRWQAGPALVRANAKGRFSYSYRIKSVPARAERIRFRAYVPAESSWAYAAGWSKQQTITHYRR
jgi:hypothetical protein